MNNHEKDLSKMGYADKYNFFVTKEKLYVLCTLGLIITAVFIATRGLNAFHLTLVTILLLLGTITAMAKAKWYGRRIELLDWKDTIRPIDDNGE